jgi:hypothetical protein
MAKIKITKGELRKLVRESAAVGKPRQDLETPEERVDDIAQVDVAPGDLADTLEKQIDILKALKIQESIQAKKLEKTQERIQKILKGK